jgi:hypothetical protein
MTNDEFARIREVVRQAGIDRTVLEALAGPTPNYDVAGTRSGVTLTAADRQQIEEFRAAIPNFDLGRFIRDLNRHLSVEQWNAFMMRIPPW